MRCFDEPLNLRGNGEADEFDQFVLQFTYCVDDANGVDCLTSREAKREMRGKAILILSNQRTAKKLDLKDIALDALDELESDIESGNI